jgi:excisionase family DNA binding protein
VAQTQTPTLTVDRLLTVRDVAALCAVSRMTVYRLIRAGRLPAVRLTPTGQLRFRRRDVEALIARGLKGEA